ncbi:hypothetical protein JHW43_001718 [Diplocarpon mali]|nr:hypothetical protein JHW43_001718 [Diplocarpon mali]
MPRTLACRGFLQPQLEASFSVFTWSTRRVALTLCSQSLETPMEAPKSSLPRLAFDGSAQSSGALRSRRFSDANAEPYSIDLLDFIVLVVESHLVFSVLTILLHARLPPPHSLPGDLAMPWLPAGSTTGVYYIPVSGLPWNTSWKQLKDFTRSPPNEPPIEIEHAHVYPGSNSTSGWISVLGRENFLRALVHLNHSPFQGPDPSKPARILTADNRNETNPVMLASMPNVTWSPSRQQTPRQPQYSDQSFMQDTVHLWARPPPVPLSSYSPVSPAFPDPYFQPPSPHYTASPSFECLVQSEYIAAPQPQNMIFSPLATPQYIPMQQPIYMVPIPYAAHPMPPPHQYTPRPTPPPTPQSASPQRTIKTEARKIMIMNLPPTTSKTELHELLSRVSSTPSSSSSSSSSRHRRPPEGTRYHLQQLELASRAGGRPRRHAFAVFESHLVAERTIARLNGLKWHGQELRAKFAKEGFVEAAAVGSRSRRRQIPSPRHQCVEAASASGSERTEEECRNTFDRLAAHYSHMDIGIDYRARCSASLASGRDASVLSRSSLSSEGEGEMERGRRMRSRDVPAGRNSPLVVDGTSAGQRR